ncbi:MAG: hypothetical protein J6Q53_04295 [Oscillospiraceae bacterium]|nr:hypothetical protein [Oscillospiraceae bacterium]
MKEMEKMKEKLTEILESTPFVSVPFVDASMIADHLIKSGIIVPPCKIGDDIWWIDAEDFTVKCEENGVTGIVITKDEFLIRDKGGCDTKIGTQFCYLSKEDAEKDLAEEAKQCKYCKDEICVNADCPVRADYCPVPDNPGVCRYEERGASNG